MRLSRGHRNNGQNGGVSSDALSEEFEVRTLSHDDLDLTTDLAHLINRAYRAAQSEIFSAPSPRISETDCANLILAHELVIVRCGESLVGAVRVATVDDRTRFFGLLAVAPEWSSKGVGRMLLDTIERDAARAGVRTMALDLLMPDPATAHQSRLRDWYESRGYVATSSRSFAEVEPEAARELRYPTQLIRYLKNIAHELD